jgi:hypothetical protein
MHIAPILGHIHCTLLMLLHFDDLHYHLSPTSLQP